RAARGGAARGHGPPAGRAPDRAAARPAGAPLRGPPRHDPLLPDLHRGLRADARRAARQHADPRLSPLRARLLSFRDGLRLRDRLPAPRSRGHHPLPPAPCPRARSRGGPGVRGSRLTMLALSGIALLSIAPLLYMARVSLGVGNALPIAPADWWGGGWTLDHYRALAASGGMGRFALNSLIVTAVAVPIQIVLSAAGGHALARGRFVAKGVFLALATAFLILPRQVTLVPLYLLFSRLGLLDTYAGLILPHLADPFGVLFMAHYYQSLSPELEEAARTDGLGPRAIFWRIILPLSGPGLAVVGVNGFLTTWNAFLNPLVLTTS